MLYNVKSIYKPIINHLLVNKKIPIVGIIIINKICTSSPVMDHGPYQFFQYSTNTAASLSPSFILQLFLIFAFEASSSIFFLLHATESSFLSGAICGAFGSDPFLDRFSFNFGFWCLSCWREGDCVFGIWSLFLSF
jgi:hypothetical protein